MLKKQLTYTNYNDVEVTETFYFNLTETELLEMEATTKGGLGAKIQQVIDAKDMPSIMSIFKELILKAYGEKSDDGKYFRKSKEISEAFAQTEAYSILFMELATDEKAATEFINGIIPKKNNIPQTLK